MILWHIVVLALVQGITEFLPISSQAHLILTSKGLGWQDQGLLIDIALHVGTLALQLCACGPHSGTQGGYVVTLASPLRFPALASLQLWH